MRDEILVIVGLALILIYFVFLSYLAGLREDRLLMESDAGDCVVIELAREKQCYEECIGDRTE